MRLEVLSSGSEGNSCLVRAGELVVLVDAGLARTEMERRLELARLPPGALGHVLVTHAHHDHARSAGLIARRERATLHVSAAQMRLAFARRSPRLSALPVGGEVVLTGAHGPDELRVTSVALPHDCDPTVAFRLEHEGRVAVVLTDLGRPDESVARQLSGAHLLLLEFNYDPQMMERGPYPVVLRRRISGGRGHLSNAQAARMLELLAGPQLHTLVLAHLSSRNNRPELALEAARGALERLGLAHVRTLVASQHEPLESLAV